MVELYHAVIYMVDEDFKKMEARLKSFESIVGG
jgi:hypothetical protein